MPVSLFSAKREYLKPIKSFNLLLSRNDYTYPDFYGDGKASEFICNKIVNHL